MVSSKAKNVDEYLAELPPPRREVIATIRALVNRNLLPGYAETMNWGMISWEIPLSRYPNTYNKQPLSFAALAAQKSHYALYLNSMCADPGHETRLRAGYAAAGKRIDLGKSCLRFKRLEEVEQDAVAAAVAAVTVEDYIAYYENSRSGRLTAHPAPTAVHASAHRLLLLASRQRDHDVGAASRRELLTVCVQKLAAGRRSHRMQAHGSISCIGCQRWSLLQFQPDRLQHQRHRDANRHPCSRT